MQNRNISHNKKHQMTQRSQQYKKQGNKSKMNNSFDGVRAQPNALVTLPKRVSSIMPDRLMTRLTYYGVTVLTIPTTAKGISRRWIPSAVFDVDPILGSTTVVGFQELAAFYSKYRSYASKLKVTFSNQSDTAVQAITVPLNADPGSSPSDVVRDAWVNNPYAKVRLLGPTGSPALSLTTLMSTEKIFGSKMVYTDDNFQSDTSTNPVNNWYWAVAVQAPSIPTVAKLIAVEIDITLDVEFFARRVLFN